MLERINQLLHDWRLDYLGYEREFMGVRGKLTTMREHLFAGQELKNGQGKYIKQVEKHIQNINPHKMTGTIDGEPDQEYWVITGMDK